MVIKIKMKQNQKKIIAREFLILVACASVFGLAFISTILFNYVIELRIEKLKTISQSLSDSTNKVQIHFLPKIDKQSRFFEISKANGWHTSQLTCEEFWTRLQNLNERDSVKFKWENEWSSGFKKEIYDQLGFKNASDFEIYIENNSLTQNELEERLNAEKIGEEREIIERKILTENYNLMDSVDRLEFSFMCLMTIVVLSFPLRYLFYAIRWSFKTIKQKDQ
ncbi:MAG: hypothetical protein RLZZ71_2142 [Bacteroidota bacterium]|jgi:hypothetical protein